MLKLAGVKTEAAFYKKYPTEAAFFKAHPEAKKLLKAQGGNTFPMPPMDYSVEAPSGLPTYTPNQEDIISQNQQITGDTANPLFDTNAKKGLDISGNMITGLFSGVKNVFGAFGDQKSRNKELKKENALLKLNERLINTPDVNEPLQKHVLDRPENYIASTSSYHPAQGTGYDILRGVGRNGYSVRKAQEGFVQGMGPNNEQYEYGNIVSTAPTNISDNLEDAPGGMMGRTPMMPEESAATPEPAYTPVEHFDPNSARDTWEAKTGLPWSAAKKLGYTDGSSKDNIKLLGELNDSRFNKDRLRKTPIVRQEAQKSVVSNINPETVHTPAPRNVKPSKETIAAFNRLKKGTYSKADIHKKEEANYIQLAGEALANPVQFLGEYAKYREAPEHGFSKHKKNAYDQVIGMINPAYWANALSNAVDYTGEGEYKKAAMEAADALPALGKLKYTKHIPFEKGLPAAREVIRRAGYLGKGAERIGSGSFPSTFVSNGILSYQDGGYLPMGQDGINNFGPRYDIYSDGGFEPMGDSDNIKQYGWGGNLINKGKDYLKNSLSADSLKGSAASGAMSAITGLMGNQFDNNAGFQAGNVVSMFNPALGAFTSTLGGFADNAFGFAGKNKGLQKRNDALVNRNMGNTMYQNLGAYSPFRQEGGYVSHDWNPQVIAKFGDHNAEDVYDFAHEGMNSLRSGGHLKDPRYTPVSERGLETFAPGGELRTHWGGEVKPVSYNPFSEGEGLTYNAYGNSHFEKDHKGRTGIGLSILQDGGNTDNEPDVEIETNEPISITDDGAVVYGNLNANKDFLKDFNLPDEFAGKKVKHIVNKIIVPREKRAMDALAKIKASSASNTSFGLLNDKTSEIRKKGLEDQLKNYAQQKKGLADLQEFVKNTTDHYSEITGKEVSQEKFAKNGTISNVLAKGEISQAARNGKTVKAQNGEYTIKGNQPGAIDYNEPNTAGGIFYGKNYDTMWGPKRDAAFSDPEMAKKIIQDLENYSGQDADDVKAALAKEKTLAGKIAKAYELAADYKVGPYHNVLNQVIDKNTTPSQEKKTEIKKDEVDYSPLETEKKKFPWGALINGVAGMMEKPFNMPLDKMQIMPELFSMANNRPEGLYEPHVYSMQETPYKYNANANRDAILSQARTASKNAGNNPAAQAAIMAQVADSMNQIGSRELDVNQQTEQGVYNRNIATHNQDLARNAAIDLDALNKYSEARSKTKTQTIEDLKSMAAKQAANKAENMQYNVASAMFPDYTFNSSGKLIKKPRYVEFDTTGKNTPTGKGGSGGLAPGYEFTYDASGNIIGTRKSGKEDVAKEGKTIKAKAQNGNIIKAFKNL